MGENRRILENSLFEYAFQNLEVCGGFAEIDKIENNLILIVTLYTLNT